MSNQLPITIPPRRTADPPTMAAQFLSKLQTSESCKSSPCVRKKLEPKYNFQLHLGSHSVQASPLPHRRLDKLHGVIHDKQPSFVHLNECASMSPDLKRRYTDCSVRSYPDQMIGSPHFTRRRLDSDCSCSPIHRASPLPKSACDCAKLSSEKSLQFDCENLRKSMKNDKISDCDAVVYQQSGNSSSSAGAIYSRVNEMENCSSESKLSEDKTIISGWLKFRDNKKWKIRWGVITKISPAADCLHLQLYRDSKEWYKNGPTKASLSLQHFLGIETGFTLDKESNTIAILCQDVIVVLAFDTREKLIQWQAKITNTLGDDIQYLILVSSTPPKAKVTTGPARLHIQDQRFCLTTGVPPKLTGLWNIGHLRRYGVVDGRFCFEGGSACGKGEGLYIFITDVGEEITQTIKLAAQGQLALKKRPLAQKGATLGRADTISYIGDESGMMHHDVTDCSFGTQYWPSQESRELDSNYGCGDTVSVSERLNMINELDPYGRFSKLNPERCMSCISKIGALSRSSTVNGADINDQSSVVAWTITEENKSYHSHSKSSTLKFSTPFVDKMSISSHSKKNQSMQHLVTEAICENPTLQRLACGSRKVKSPQSFVGSYENYDTPKTTIMSNSGVLYDTPKSIQEHLLQEMRCSSDKYGNYDRPQMILATKSSCQCSAAETTHVRLHEKENEQSRINCTCNRVMSWADNWIPFPYCKRGSGIENTGPGLPPKVDVRRDDNMTGGKSSTIDTRLYATIDLTKKIRKQYQDCSCSSERSAADPKTEMKTSKSTTNIPNSSKPMANYVNLTYGNSLENYENSEVVLTRPFMSKDDSMCLKCGHASKVQTLQPKGGLGPEGNYAIMSSSKVKKDFPGYTPMLPPTVVPTEEKVTEKPTAKEDVQIPSTSTTVDNNATTPTNEESLPNRKFNTIGSVKCLQNTKDLPANSSTADRKVECSMTALNDCNFDSILLRRSESVPCKSQNRDSSSSNDSGVSTSSIRYRKIDLSDYEEISVAKRWPGLVSSTNSSCIHASLIRKHKFNKDPMQCLSFEFQKTPSEKSSCKTEPADIHMYQLKQKSSESPSENTSMAGPTFIDSRSTSSGTSDMSDYIETLSLSSHSSSETAEVLKRQITSKLRPRFGKEYQNIDRLLSMNTQNLDNKNSCHSFMSNYANITPVLELVNAESPSPGYQSGTSPQDGQKDQFMFKNS